MPRFAPISFLLCLPFILAPRAQPAGTQEIAIRDLVRQYVTARNAADPEGTRRLFLSDADQLVSTGEWRKGADALVRGAMASSKKEAGNSAIEVENIRFLTPAVAIVDGGYSTSSAAGTVRKMRTTWIVIRTATGWRIAAIRNMLPAPQAATAH